MLHISVLLLTLLCFSLTGLKAAAYQKCYWCNGSGVSSTVAYVTCSECSGAGCSACLYKGCVLAPPSPCAACQGTGKILESFQIIYYEDDGVTQPHGYYTSEESIITIESPTSKREGYTFQGWATSPDGQVVSYQPGDTYLVTGNLELYAVWGGSDADDVFQDKNVCTNCHGQGTILTYQKCETCKGTHYVDVQEECSVCEGIGIVMKTTARKCPRCYGGKIGAIMPDCYVCYGEGWLYTTLGTDCINCNGTGRILTSRVCQDCSDGNIACQTKCSLCHGTGTIISVGLKGDMNHDDKVTVSDAVLLQKYILGMAEMDQDQWMPSDMNSDERVNAFDLCLLKRKIIESTESSWTD